MLADMSMVRALCAALTTALVSNATLLPFDRATTGSAQPQTGVVNITIDGSQTFQRIDGFGVNANARSWNNGQLAPAFDLLVDQMGARIFRVILEKSDWQSSSGSVDDSVYESSKFQDLWGTIGYLNSRGVVVMLNLMGTIPGWMGGDRLDEAQEDQWVSMVASMVNYGRTTRHLQFNLLSPMNEQDIGAPEGPRVSAVQYVRVVAKLTARLSALGLGDVHIVGPDAASAGAGASDYAPLMLADTALMPQVDHFSVHTYSGDTGPMANALRQSRYGDRDFWVTEWSAWCQGCDHGQPVQAEWQFASTTTDLLLNHLEHGAAAALVYEGYDSYYEHHGAFSYWGQLAFDQVTGTYSPRQRFYTNAQVFRFVSPGMIRIGSSPSDGDVRALAFRDPTSGQIVVVGHNSTGRDASLRISLQGLQLPATAFHLYQTNQSMSLTPGPDAALDTNSLSVSVAADGFFTLTTAADAGSPISTLTAPTVSAAAPLAPTAPPSTSPAPLAQPPSVPSGDQVLVGETTLQSTLDSDNPGTAEAFHYVAAASGPANRMYVYLGPGSSTSRVVVGVYDDQRGEPGSLLASGAVESPVGNQWNQAPIDAVNLVAGESYWIAILGPLRTGKMEILDAGDTGGKSVTSTDIGLLSLPATWSTGASWSSSPASAYAAQVP